MTRWEDKEKWEKFSNLFQTLLKVGLMCNLDFLKNSQVLFKGSPRNQHFSTATDILPKNVADMAIATLPRIVAAIDIDTGKL